MNDEVYMANWLKLIIGTVSGVAFATPLCFVVSAYNRAVIERKEKKGERKTIQSKQRRRQTGR